MVNLALIYHMHQPYYKDLLKDEFFLPWVRLHGIKDYFDMVEILKNYPKIHATFNLVPSLLEQIVDYTKGSQDLFQKISYKEIDQLTEDDKRFVLDNFIKIDPNRVISVHPRFYELYKKKLANKSFTDHDYQDLIVWFNLSWFDPYFRENIPELKSLVKKARFFNHEDKIIVLEKQKDVLKEIIPVYKEHQSKGQIEITLTPFYHPIMPLLFDTNSALKANPKAVLPRDRFSYPQDITWHVEEAVRYFTEIFGIKPKGMWPSEQSVSEEILPFIIKSGINWIVADEAILFNSLRKKTRDTKLLYKTHALKRKEGILNIIFRDRNLSDLIGFEYKNWDAKLAALDFVKHLENIDKYFKGKDSFVAVALDGENAWEYFRNDGWDFLTHFYQALSDCPVVKTVTVSEYLKDNAPQNNIKHLATGSWIFANFNKWIGSPQKNLAWTYIKKAREELDKMNKDGLVIPELALKQMRILEGSDWFWWFDDNQMDFDQLFRIHLRNFYTFINKQPPEYVNRPL